MKMMYYCCYKGYGRKCHADIGVQCRTNWVKPCCCGCRCCNPCYRMGSSGHSERHSDPRYGGAIPPQVEQHKRFPAIGSDSALMAYPDDNSIALGFRRGGELPELVFSEDGLTLDIRNEIEIGFPEGTVITGLAPWVRLIYYDSACRENAFTSHFGLYEAPRSSWVYTIIPESIVDLGSWTVPPYEDKTLINAATGLNIRTSADKHYVFAFYHGYKTADGGCAYLFRVGGEYSYRSA